MIEPAISPLSALTVTARPKGGVVPRVALRWLQQVCNAENVEKEIHADVAELADAPDLGSGEVKTSWGFKSLYQHHGVVRWDGALLCKQVA